MIPLANGLLAGGRSRLPEPGLTGKGVVAAGHRGPRLAGYVLYRKIQRVEKRAGGVERCGKPMMQNQPAMTAATDFGQWLDAVLERLAAEQGVSARAVERLAQVGQGLLSKVRRGHVPATAGFQVPVLVALWRCGAFRDAGEVLAGWARLGVTPAAAQALVAHHPLVAEGAVPAAAPLGQQRRDFLRWLQAWQAGYVDPRRQGVQLPAWYVPRPAELATLRAWLLRPTTGRLALWGPGGSGKTVLAQAVALDEQLVARYPGGVWWAELGPAGEPAAILRRWARLLGLAPPPDETPAELAQDLVARLQAAGRPCLFILDDVWQTAPARAVLLPELPGSSYLLTVRERHLAQQLALDDAILAVPGLTAEEVVALVRQRLGPQWRPAAAAAAQQWGDGVAGLAPGRDPGGHTGQTAGMGAHGGAAPGAPGGARRPDLAAARVPCPQRALDVGRELPALAGGRSALVGAIGGAGPGDIVLATVAGG